MFDLFTSSIKEEKEVQEIPSAEQLVLAVPSSIVDWREQFIKYLTSVDIPTDKTKTKCLMVYGDSVLVINQANKDWSYSSEKMDAYYTEIRKLEGKFYGIKYHHVVRDQNQLTDHLSKIGSSRAAIPPRVFV